MHLGRQITPHPLGALLLNAMDFGRAASFGDISENAEYSAALDKQERIMRRLGELRDALDRARILEPDEVTTDRVVIGTRVRLLNKGSGAEETFSLLGPWDVDLEKGMLKTHRATLDSAEQVLERFKRPLEEIFVVDEPAVAIDKCPGILEQ